MQVGIKQAVEKTNLWEQATAKVSEGTNKALAASLPFLKNHFYIDRAGTSEQPTAEKEVNQ
ncbi:MAG: hypothetical protein IT292_01305 [Deltaproteobacteria bacterium]|nr:hypothetical protein [Deltaproteobacteria bacterium]